MRPQLHLASRSEDLLSALRPALAAARTTALAATTGIPRPVSVLVPSQQLSDWLQARLARDLGLSMGFEFLTPADYFKRHFAAEPAAAAFAQANAFWSPDHLRWQLLPHIETVAAQLGHNPAQTLAPRARFAFAELLARQFDRYTRQRPDWPTRWRKNQSPWRTLTPPLPAAVQADEAWQRRLWHTVAAQADAPPHPASLLASLASSAPVSPQTPLFVVGADLLDPLLLRTLQTLAQHKHAVALYLLFPSLGYLADQSRRRALSARVAATAPEDALELGGHPLLASLGQQAVGNFLLLETLSPDYAEWPDSPDCAAPVPAAASLLQRLQADIRAQRTPPGETSPDSRPALDPDDLSLRVHCAHSPRRELEILRDELLRAFNDLPGLQPEEVLVAVTDFDTYAPLAEGILRSGELRLPVRLTAIPAREANPVAVALLALLRLSLGRQTASEVIELLTLSAVQHHLGLAEDNETLALLAETIRSAGLTHGIEPTAATLGDATGTWRAALDRHLAGAWFGPEPEARGGDSAFAHPLAHELPAHDAERLAFISWLEALARHLRSWTAPVSAAVWAERLDHAITGLLHSSAHDDHAAALRRQLAELSAVAAPTPLDAGALLDWLQPQLDNATSLRTSLGGEILFGRLDQLHGLPCRVLAILGLQDGAFPRANRRPAWDILAPQPERWDVDPRTQDRQHFLDALLCPRDRLILTASNRSLRSAHDGPLSSCVEELLRAAAATVRPFSPDESLNQHLVVAHRIQPFAADYFTASGQLPRSFNAQAARITADLVHNVSTPPEPFLVAPSGSPAPAAEPLEITLTELVTFWKDPARAWLRTLNLETTTDEADDTALDDPPLNLDALQAYHARQTALLASIAPGTDASAAGARLMADRALPPGALGNLAWEQNTEEIAPLAGGINRVLPQTEIRTLDIAIDSLTRLTGDIQICVTPPESPWLLRHRPGKFSSVKYQLEAFIPTLAAALFLNKPVSIQVFGTDCPNGLTLPPLDSETARRHLAALLAGYRAGQARPLEYAPETSAALAKALTKADPATALETAEATWTREPYKNQPGGEGTTTDAQLAWRETDPFAEPHASAWLAWAESVAAPLQTWWSSAT
ncbi:MAG: exodeoxyribonuclease V subunit gamma [Verrucomicrobia bacterium]|nr:exodeoxyribonuclease V subunit gamma [Verrucomicrobiota bacterium]